MTFRTVARRGYNNFHKKTYQQIVLDTAPFAYWPLSETTGTQATDIVGGFHGTYNNVTLNATTFPDGSPAPLFDASNERVALPATNLDTPFDPTQGAIACWLRVRASTVWTDGTVRTPFSLGADASNRIFHSRSATNGRFDQSYRAGGTAEDRANTGLSFTTWFHSAITWDADTDTVAFYLNGLQTATSSGLGTWAGTLATSFTALGNFTSAGGANFWDGYIKHVAAWNYTLSANQIAGLVPSRFLA